MKKLYQVYKIETKEICVESTDYYRKNGDFQTDSIEILSFCDYFNTENEAISFLEELPSGEYTILTVYSK